MTTGNVPSGERATANISISSRPAGQPASRPDWAIGSNLPYLKLSYDTLARGAFDEGDSPIAQSWSSDRLSATAAEAGLDWQLCMKESRQGTWAFEGRVAYRNRFHIEDADDYRWAGISDSVGDSFRNRHTGRLQLAIAREIPSGHTFRLVAAGETGDSGFSRYGLEGHWSYRF